tara:strand:+ start:3899 stop:5080 length:1182 start_codon:yes stop_codon:yes gene_type:complete
MNSFLVNKKSFKSLDDDALSFFESNGFVVLEGVYSDETLDTSIEELDRLRGMFAEDLEITIDDYDKRICQWRDLWMRSTHFNKFLRVDKMIEAAKFFLRENSIQMLHDHVIRKPFSALNETVPWHQDFPFWPVDTPNSLSCWIPMEQVKENGGCLEVIVGSHLWGASPPVDFIMDPKDFSGRDDIIRIPVKKGDIVVLNSLTWHRSNPNEVPGTSRPVYLALWIPSTARYRPDLAGWHPVNEHVTVVAGEFLNEDKFPMFGERVLNSSVDVEINEIHTGPSVENKYMDMFEAAPKISQQICKILSIDTSDTLPSLPSLIEDKEIRVKVFERCLESGILHIENESWYADLLDSMLVNSAAFQKHRARNIYNDAYAKWWFEIGSKWADIWTTMEE